ncbi:hypothetical protein BJ875DRAFT_475684 [Amylocarpus encephaloides]|uniref:Glycosyltransferase 2 n=1 Tax=Amylocarpus encephaloides TaxID=45428 RepID=A0A9P7Y8N2_9HELO|nr:hypothetical protein BJ875DRAFT_475684 [Amylocarpus encephaloides]
MGPRIFVGDEELGKRDDEYRPGKKSPLGLGIVWQQRRSPHMPLRRNVKRISLGILALISLYYFFYNMPTDLQQPRQRPNYHPAPPQSDKRPVLDTNTPKKSASVGKPGTKEEIETPAHDFSGPIKFYELAASLYAVAGTSGSELINRNVLFAAASLKSVSSLLPIACEMALQERSFVHFAMLGRDDMPMDIIKSVNGIGKECKIIFHDARADFAMQSTEFRMQVSTSAAFNHINNFVHPQATLLDGSGEEEAFLMKGLKPRAINLGRTIIELPETAEQNLMWLTLLDSASLSAWNKATVDIVIHAQPAASGSIMRLLNSLRKADFSTSVPPRLTIELPSDIDSPTSRYLEHFRWPPNAEDNAGNLLSLHHRIPQHGLTPEENSIRFVESFWPADPFANHVLVLAPQAELSPLFFHYLKYTILEYKYSTTKSGLIHQKNLMGVSLDLPSTYLNDSTTFIPPTTNSSMVTPFLWQAPNSNAALYFGDKWVELHDFVAHSLSSAHELPSPTTLNERSVSKTYPSWLEHVLKLARARGYWMLYPGVGSADSLATLHNELYHAPEEYAGVDVKEESPKYGDLTADPDKHKLLEHKEASLITRPLGTILPSDGVLPTVGTMPLLDWAGEDIDVNEIELRATVFSAILRHEVGGCDQDVEEKPRVDFLASDLFCLDDKRMVKEVDQKVDKKEETSDEKGTVETEGEAGET